MTKPRAILVVDVQNLFYSVRDIYGKPARISFPRMYERCREKYELIDAAAYLAIDARGQTQLFCESLRNAGFRTVISQIKIEDRKIYGTDWDVGITVKVIEKIDDFDVLILASGDGDYRHLFKYVHDRGKLAVAMGFRNEISRTLEKFADEVMYLTNEDIFYQAEKDKGEGE